MVWLKESESWDGRAEVINCLVRKLGVKFYRDQQVEGHDKGTDS